MLVQQKEIPILSKKHLLNTNYVFSAVRQRFGKLIYLEINQNLGNHKYIAK